MVNKVTVVIPNLNGMKFIEACMDSLFEQEFHKFEVLLIDNGSTDGSMELVQEKYPQVKVIALGTNTGFCRAVNEGIRAAQSPYVLLLNNDTKVLPGFIQHLVTAIESGIHPERIFSVSSRMLNMQEPEMIDDAGDYYCALGWAFARGKGKPSHRYDQPAKVFAACGGASLYRKAVFDEIGLFDEEHFAYLEDIDIGYRARIFGYENKYEPKAQVLHAGSASSGSRYNTFKVSMSSSNSVYLIGKNMPLLQLVVNLPFLLLGYIIKWLFFIRKKMGRLYVSGCIKGLKKCFSQTGRRKKVPFQWKHLGNYLKIQLELWANILRLLKV